MAKRWNYMRVKRTSDWEPRSRVSAEATRRKLFMAAAGCGMREADLATAASARLERGECGAAVALQHSLAAAAREKAAMEVARARADAEKIKAAAEAEAQALATGADTMGHQQNGASTRWSPALSFRGSGGAGDRGWCLDAWCWVDPTDCNVAWDESTYVPGSGLAYS